MCVHVCACVMFLTRQMEPHYKERVSEFVSHSGSPTLTTPLSTQVSRTRPSEPLNPSICADVRGAALLVLAATQRRRVLPTTGIYLAPSVSGMGWVLRGVTILSPGRNRERQGDQRTVLVDSWSGALRFAPLCPSARVRSSKEACTRPCFCSCSRSKILLSFDPRNDWTPVPGAHGARASFCPLCLCTGHSGAPGVCYLWCNHNQMLFSCRSLLHTPRRWPDVKL